MTQEELRLQEDRERKANWKRWGPYLSERQWGTVREDYSAGGHAGSTFPTIMRGAERIGGARTDWEAFAIATSLFASLSHCGTAAIPF